MECSICLEQFSKNRPVTLSCGHIYHKNCIKNWLKNNDACPLCRDESQQLKIKWDYDDLNIDELYEIKLNGELNSNNFDWRHNSVDHTSTTDNFCLIL